MNFLIFYLADFTLSGRNNARKMKFSIKNFFSKCDQICSFQQLVTFTEEILNGKLHFFVQCLMFSQSIVTRNGKSLSVSCDNAQCFFCNSPLSEPFHQSCPKKFSIYLFKLTKINNHYSK